jgi:mono/diheme cytochrome c family protein
MLRTLSSTVILALCTPATVDATDATGRIYYQHYCAACHGRSGRGNGFVAPARRAPYARHALARGARFEREFHRIVTRWSPPQIVATVRSERRRWRPATLPLRPIGGSAPAQLQSVMSQSGLSDRRQFGRPDRGQFG